MNSVNIIGRLTRDVDNRHLQDGTAIASFTLAVDTGTKQSPATMFLDVTAFGKTAEIVGQYAGTKGMQLAISGRLKQDNWEDKNGGGKRSKICAVAERITLLNNRKDGDGQSRDEQQSPPDESQVPPASYDEPTGAANDADVPF